LFNKQLAGFLNPASGVVITEKEEGRIYHRAQSGSLPAGNGIL
jgi:hypothetical protein